MSFCNLSIPGGIMVIKKYLYWLTIFAWLIFWYGYSQASQIPSDPITVDEFNLPAQDEQGWSLLVPSLDSRLIYVDASSGDDLTAITYFPSDPAIGSDPQQPVGNILAYRTLEAAKKQLRFEMPDWILLRSGEMWEESLDIKRGRSIDERQVATSWGRGPRPELRTGTKRGIINTQLSNVAITGIRFWAHTRDTEGPYFVSYEGSQGFGFFSRDIGDPRQVRDILIEDCHFHSYTNNSLVSHYSNGGETLTNFIMRRSIISGNYSINSHSQGLGFGSGSQPLLPAILLEENLFDHNGWRVQRYAEVQNDRTDGQATMYNHNTYFSSASGIIFNRNIFMRASSMGNKWTSISPGASEGIVLDNNLYIDGEIGISMGGNTLGPLRFKNIVIRDNVFTDIGRSRPTNRNLSWGLEVKDWDNGLVHKNLFVNQSSSDVANTYGLQMDAETSMREVVISSNTIANLYAENNASTLRLLNGNNVENVHIVDMTIHSNVSNPAVKLNSRGYTFSGTNHYYTQSIHEARFQVAGSSTDLVGWKKTTGDIGATLGAPSFSEPNRTLETYIELLNLGTAYKDFINAVYEQSRSNWNPALTAGSINEWFRQGFGMSEVLSRDHGD